MKMLQLSIGEKHSLMVEPALSFQHGVFVVCATKLRQESHDSLPPAHSMACHNSRRQRIRWHATSPQSLKGALL